MKSGWIVTGIAVLVVAVTAFAVRWINSASPSHEVTAAKVAETQTASVDQYPAPVVSVAAVAVSSPTRIRMTSRSTSMYGDGDSFSRPTRHSRRLTSTSKKHAVADSTFGEDKGTTVARIVTENSWASAPNAR